MVEPLNHRQIRKPSPRFRVKIASAVILQVYSTLLLNELLFGHCIVTLLAKHAIKATLVTKQVSTAASWETAVGRKGAFFKRCYWQGFARNLAIEGDWENIYGIEAFHEWHVLKIQHPSAR